MNSAAGAAAIVFLLGACGSEAVDTTARPTKSPKSDTSSYSGSPSSGATSADPQVTACVQLLQERWQPPREEAPDISYDPESGVAKISFTNEQLVVNIFHDPECQRLPVIGKMIKQIVERSSRQ